MDNTAHKPNKSKSSNTIVTSTNIWKSFETGDKYTTILKDISFISISGFSVWIS